jgi:hypothetical protein
MKNSFPTDPPEYASIAIFVKSANVVLLYETRAGGLLSGDLRARGMRLRVAAGQRQTCR